MKPIHRHDASDAPLVRTLARADEHGAAPFRDILHDALEPRGRDEEYRHRAEHHEYRHDPGDAHTATSVPALPPGFDPADLRRPERPTSSSIPESSNSSPTTSTTAPTAAATAPLAGPAHRATPRARPGDASATAAEPRGIPALKASSSAADPAGPDTAVASLAHALHQAASTEPATTPGKARPHKAAKVTATTARPGMGLPTATMAGPTRHEVTAAIGDVIGRLEARPPARPQPERAALLDVAAERFDAVKIIESKPRDREDHGTPDDTVGFTAAPTAVAAEDAAAPEVGPLAPASRTPEAALERLEALLHDPATGVLMDGRAAVVTVDGLKVRVVTDANGHTSVSMLAQHESLGATLQGQAASLTQGLERAGLQLDHLRVESGSATWQGGEQGGEQRDGHDGHRDGGAPDDRAERDEPTKRRLRASAPPAGPRVTTSAMTVRA